MHTSLFCRLAVVLLVSVGCALPVSAVPVAAGCQLQGGFFRGSFEVCSYVTVQGEAGNPVNQVLDSSYLVVQAGSFANPIRAGQGTAEAKTQLGRNGASASSVSTTTGSPPFANFVIGAQAYSVWWDTFYVKSSGPFVLEINWALDGILEAMPLNAGNAVGSYSLSIARFDPLNILGGFPTLNYSSGFENSAFTPIYDLFYKPSGTAIISGVGDTVFGLESRLWSATNGFGRADFLNTAMVDFTVASGTVEMTDASGQLIYDSGRFRFGEPIAISEPSGQLLVLLGIGAILLTWRISGSAYRNCGPDIAAQRHCCHC
jgi:hypothetical protein